MTKKIGGAILLVLIVLCIYYWSLITYGVGQGLGQLRIIREARPVDEFMKDPSFPDSLKAKLRSKKPANSYLSNQSQIIFPLIDFVSRPIEFI